MQKGDPIIWVTFALKEVLLELIYYFIDHKSASETIYQRQILWAE